MRVPKVLIALSGGVDSSVAAALLVREGYDCAAIFYELWAPTKKQGKGWENNCCTLEAYRDAKRVAKQLGIPLYRANIGKEFHDTVVKYFIDEYAAGRTPNPCVVCNTDVRFGLMFDRAVREYQADYLATGHYAIRDHVESWRMANHSKYGSMTDHRLITAVDQRKDQSYFLYRVPQTVLGQLMFPLGGMRKEQDVRALAKKMGLPTASKHDSQEICFVPKGGVSAFLKQTLKPRSAQVVSTAGQTLGTHPGAALVTLGQRRGLGSFGTSPHFVVARDVLSDVITVTADARDVRLFTREFELDKATWVRGEPASRFFAEARGRHGQVPFAVEVRKLGRDWVVRPLERERQIAPGQSLVIIRGGEVLGGGLVRGDSARATLPTHARVPATS